MYFNESTLKKIYKLTKKKEFSYLFDRLGDLKTDTPDNVLEGLANAFSEELGVEYDKKDKLVFLLKLAYLANGEKK